MKKISHQFHSSQSKPLHSKLSQTKSSKRRQVTLLGLFIISLIVVAAKVNATELKVMNTGLGDGTISSSAPGINCPGDCDQSYGTADTVTLTATPATGSVFVRWDGDAFADPSSIADCSGTSTTCMLTMSADRSVRPVFALATPIPTITDVTSAGLQSYLTANPTVDTPAEFINALPVEYKRNWLLMSRSESLQTGTARYPRILLPNADARFVFSIGMQTHSSYPGSHPNAIEYMQWDAAEKNFRFHEIVLTAIGPVDTDGDGVGEIPARMRGVVADDEKCTKCHSTRNIPNSFSSPGTTGITPVVKAKNKPNWDAYDSWGGLAPFNRDRIYQGSVGAATFRKMFNPWTWRNEEPVRKVMEQLQLQPPGVPPAHEITRTSGGTNDGHVNFQFDISPPVLTEPAPAGSASITTNYAFDGSPGTGTATSVTRGGTFVTLHHADTPTNTEGRGVQLFDLIGGLDGNLNPQRIADELIDHSHATGSAPGNVHLIDVRPIALAIAKGSCLSIDAAANAVTSSAGTLSIDQDFFVTRNGMTINQILNDTRRRAESLPMRKADIQKLNFDRTGDVYTTTAENGLIQEYGTATSQGTNTTLSRIRQEVFRRPIDLGSPDATFMSGMYVDREIHGSNSPKLALFRFFLEPLGVSVDKWSMGVRGRSRTYTFADVFGSYTNTLVSELRTSLLADPVAGVTDPNSCADLITGINNTLSASILPDASGADALPTYTDVQRIFNKSCIECHGGLDYPPYGNYGTYLNLSEDDNPTPPDDRMDRSHGIALSFVSANPATSTIYRRITDNLSLVDPADDTKLLPYDASTLNQDCPYGVMPCGGPPLAQADIETIRRWIEGGSPNTRGDPHIKTVDNVHYDFQAAGEFVLLRGQGFEMQARHTPVVTNNALGPNGHTGLTSCVSINTAIAVKVGQHRISYQPIPSPDQDDKRTQELQLIIDGEPVQLTSQGLLFGNSGRVIPTSVPGGVKIEAPGGTAVILTPGYWSPYKVWYLNVETEHVRANAGLMGNIAPGNWLPTLPNGTSLGARPSGLQDRYKILYGQFGNAWRVTDSNTLFDYAPGTSTDTFSVESWPKGESPQNCELPPGVELPPGISTPTQLPEPLTLDTARQHCAGVVEDAARTSCEQDVMVTGEPGFAQTYLNAEKVTRNAKPAIPVLTFPGHFETGLTTPVNFNWNRTVDADDKTLTYHHCVWEVSEGFNLNNCDTLKTDAEAVGTGIYWAVIAGIVGLVIFVLLLLLGARKKPVLVFLLGLMLLAVIILAYYLGWTQVNSKPFNITATELESGKTYYWKVIVEDGKGGTVESEMRKFELE